MQEETFVYSIKKLFIDIKDSLSQIPAILLPFACWIVGTVYVFIKSVSVFNNVSSGSFVDFLIEVFESIIIFNLLFCPLIIIINLWTLYIVKQHQEEQKSNVFSALFSIIKFRFILLLPFVFIWMFAQGITAALLVFVAMLAGVSRGSVGNKLFGGLFAGIFSITMFLMCFLFFATPGMVFDNLNIFSSIKKMYTYINRYKERITYVASASVIFFVVLVFVLYFLLSESGIYLYVMSALVLSFVFYMQLRIAQFYLWSSSIIYNVENALA
jgi:hypothetical protein